MKKKWDDFYDSESELIKEMLLCCSNTNDSECWKLCKGYEYIESFKRYYRKNGCLTEKQMVQVKRLAGEIYKNVHETLKLR